MNQAKPNSENVCNQDNGVHAELSLYTNKELLQHIESMSWRFLYIFAFLWGGLFYLFLKFVNNDILNSLIEKVMSLVSISPEMRLFLLLPFELLIMLMLVTFWVLIYNCIDREVNLQELRENDFISKKQKRLKLAVIIGFCISAIIILFLIMVLINPSDILQKSFIFLSKATLELVTFGILIFWATRKSWKNLRELRKDWKVKEKNLNASKTKEISKFKRVINSLEQKVKSVKLLIQKTYLSMLGILIYVTYILVKYFNVQKLGWWIWVFLISLFIFFISFMFIFINDKNYSKSNIFSF
jgi:hypothetical protein